MYVCNDACCHTVYLFALLCQLINLTRIIDLPCPGGVWSAVWKDSSVWAITLSLSSLLATPYLATPNVLICFRLNLCCLLQIYVYTTYVECGTLH